MTSNSPPAYPAEYYYPEFIDNRTVSSHVSYPTSSPPLSTSIKATTNSTKQRTKNVAMNIVTNHGLPDSDINESAKTDPKKYLIRDPGERNIPKLIVDENMLKQNMRSPTLLSINHEHNKNLESKPIPNGHTNENFMKRTRPITSIRKQHQVVKFAEDQQPIDEYWKKEILIDDEGVVAIEPIQYDKNTYEGPFGLTRKGSFIFYIGMAIFTLLAAVFLIMTGVFYGQSYPDSSANSAKLAGIGICALAFYIGLQLILIALWHQKYRQENPVRKIKKRSTVHNESQDYLKTSMENNKPYGHSYQPPVDYSYQPPVDYSYQPPVDYSYQPPVDYTPYGYYSNPPYTNEQMILQQPGAATGAASYDTVVWPSNVEVETQPDTKFLQPMDYSLGLQRQSTIDTTSPFGTDARLSNQIKKSKRERTKPVEAEPAVIDFDDMGFNSTVIKQPLPILPKAPETMELMQTLAQIQPTTTEKSPKNGAVSPKKTNRIQPLDNRTDVSSSINHNKNHHHHHRRHHHHHHHRHHHHHNKDSPSSQSTNSSHEYHRGRTFDHHHRDPSVSFPRIVTPQLPKIITPSLSKMSTAIYRETGSNTGNETKLTRDSSVTADLADIPNVKDDRLEQIPVLYRTIIVEPYPDQPSSQILVKPSVNMIGKIRLGKNNDLDGGNETIIYPATEFLEKKPKKRKKKSPVVKNNTIDDLELEDTNDDDQRTKIRPKRRTSTTKTIKNAFYN